MVKLFGDYATDMIYILPAEYSVTAFMHHEGITSGMLAYCSAGMMECVEYIDGELSGFVTYVACDYDGVSLQDNATKTLLREIMHTDDHPIIVWDSERRGC